MLIKNIIFDWDGTLGMTLHLWLAGYRLGMENQGHQFCDNVLVQDFFYEHEKAAKKYPHVDFDRLVRDAHQHLRDNLVNLKLYQGASQTLLALLDRGVSLALVTSSPQSIVRRGMAPHDLEKHFISIVGGDDGFGHKPHPAPFVETMGRLNARPEETLIVGDARTDILAGKAAGTHTCAFVPRDNELFHDFDELRESGADFSISQLPALTGLIQT